MKISKINLRNQFSKGDIPTQEDFWNFQDSYWHKDEEIGQNAVKGLETTLANKLDKDVETNLLNSFNSAVSKVNSILKGEATPTSSPTTWIPGGPDIFEKWEAMTVGTYSNFKDLNNQPIEVIAADLDKKIVFINMTNGVAKIDVKAVPGLTAKDSFDPNNNTEPATMKASYQASDLIVEKAFAEIGVVTGALGKDLNHTEVAYNFTPAFFQFNKRVLSQNGTLKKLKIWSGNSATLKYFHINYNDTTNAVIVKSSSLPVSVIPGNNEFSIELQAEKGDTIAIQPIGMDVGHTPGSTDIEYSNGQNPPGFNAGYLAYTVEYEYEGEAGYTVPQMRDLFNKVKALPSSGESNFTAYRITLEGQSNALGVALASGLTLAPYNTALFDWMKYFSRVFIWNPKTDSYENIKIGVNNMASWDGDYTGGAPTNQSTFGAEIGLAIMWLQTHPSGNLYIDKNVGDGKPISYFQKGTSYYNEKLSRKAKADQWLRERGISVSEIGFVWIQGEGDMTQSKAYYKAQLTSLINDRIADGFIDAKSKLVITQIPNSSGNYGAGVADAKAEYVAGNKMAVLLPYTNNFNADNIHLNTTGQINLGIKSAVNILVTDSLTFTDLQTKLFWTF